MATIAQDKLTTLTSCKRNREHQTYEGNMLLLTCRFCKVKLLMPHKILIGAFSNLIAGVRKQDVLSIVMKFMRLFIWEDI